MTKLCLTWVAVALASAGCSMLGKGGAAPGGGGGGAASPGLAGTMAEASVFQKGDTLTAPAECNTSGYMKVGTPAGEALSVVITIDAPAPTCLSVSYLNANGGTQDGGVMEEICSEESPATLDVTGLEGGSFLQISEAGACQGAKVTIALN
jgi:hypothetical protein